MKRLKFLVIKLIDLIWTFMPRNLINSSFFKILKCPCLKYYHSYKLFDYENIMSLPSNCGGSKTFYLFIRVRNLLTLLISGCIVRCTKIFFQIKFHPLRLTQIPKHKFKKKRYLFRYRFKYVVCYCLEVLLRNTIFNSL